MTPIICIAGRSQTGKTTLIEKLIPVLKNRGYRIGTIKHSHHIFEMDKTGKDSWRHKDAGAETVIIASPGKIAMVKSDHGGTLDSLVNYFSDMDLVITEGYKGEVKPKIEVVRSARHQQALLADDANLIAIVTDVDMSAEVPVFGMEDIDQLSDFIEKNFL
ncbi:MAG: molybdopterin-guanine dinucleotide biosynthesis protein B [Deltaproteobacteria bacterium]|jgi:molybdopterin-guanine dinucleotide biosynthesis protein B|nr:molybdopterin-guanine dinucleotide biosynthesis protein B [Deltaproteobacteria bacterium]